MNDRAGIPGRSDITGSLPAEEAESARRLAARRGREESRSAPAWGFPDLGVGR